MKWSNGVLLIGGVVLAVACGRDRAKSVKITSSNAGRGYQATQTGFPISVFDPAFCQLPAESMPGSSKYTGGGPCVFHHSGDVHCDAAADDFLVVMSRPAPREATLTVFINVEMYKGPGDYNTGQMWVALNNAKSGFRWGNDSFHITVGKDAKYIDMPPTPLYPERPTPDTEMVSGRLSCEAAAPK